MSSEGKESCDDSKATIQERFPFAVFQKLLDGTKEKADDGHQSIHMCTGNPSMRGVEKSEWRFDSVKKHINIFYKVTENVGHLGDEKELIFGNGSLLFRSTNEVDFMVKIQLTDDLAESYTRVIEVLSQLPQAAADIGHPYLEGKSEYPGEVAKRKSNFH